MRPRELSRSFNRLVGLVLMSGAMVLGPSAALAHADLESIDPPDRSMLEDPLDHVELAFTAPVEPVASGIRVLDGDGAKVPFTTSQPEPSLIVLVFDEPVAEGRIVVLWEARSDDGHGIEGSASFEVVGPAAAGDRDASTSTLPKESTTTTVEPPGATTSTRPTVTPVSGASTQADPEVDAGGSIPPALTGVGRWVVMGGALLAIGAAAFAAGSLVGSRTEVQRSVRWLTVGGVLVVVGTAIEIAGTGLALGTTLAGAFAPAQIVDAFSESHLVAMALRILGGMAVIQVPEFVAMARVRAPAIGTHATPRNDDSPAPQVRTAERALYRFDLWAEWLAVAGLGAIAVSFALDGHSSALGTPGRVASATHVAAAGVWAGGLWVMADTLLRRRHAARETDVAATALRFSRVAAVSIGLVGVAGIGLAVSIADSPSDLLSTPWGMLLLAKTALVLVAVGIGTYNHFRVIPRLGVPDPGASDILSRTVTVEAGIVLVVTTVTAALVGAAV